MERAKLNNRKAIHTPWFLKAGTSSQIDSKNRINAKLIESLIDFASVAPEKITSNCSPQNPAMEKAPSTENSHSLYLLLHK